MPAFRLRLRAVLVGAAAIALVTIGAGGTLAASTTPTVYACFNTSGAVAMAPIAQCKLTGGGQLVSINTQGIPGPTGPQGPVGPTGVSGPQGPTGPAGSSAGTTSVEVTVFQGDLTWNTPDGHLSIGCEVGSGRPLYVTQATFARYADLSGTGTLAFPDGINQTLTGVPSTVTITYLDNTGAHVVRVLARSGGAACQYVITY